MVWDASPDADVVAYRVYYGIGSRAYTNYAQVASPATSVVISNLAGGTIYYFGAKGVNAFGIESAFSNEATYIIPPPTAKALNISTLEDTSANVTLIGISGSGDPLSYSVKTAPGAGRLSGIAPNLVYTPNADFFGTDQFTYSVSDGLGVASATVSISVAAVNDPPTLNPINNVTVDASSGAKTISLSGISAGPANENQTITITAQSSNASLVPAPIVSYTSPNTTGSLTITPAPGQVGNTTITVTVKDGQSSISRSFGVSVGATLKISNLTAAANDARTLTVAWSTDNAATCYVEYGITSTVNMMSRQTYGTSHSVTLTNLEAGTLYYLRVTANASGSMATQVATASTEPALVVPVPAENGVISSSFTVYSSTVVQNGKYIASSLASANASYSLTLQRGPDYRIWARVETPAGGASFNLYVDGVQRIVFAGDAGATNQFHWVLLTEDANRSNPVVCSLATGTHSFVIVNAAGVWIDEFVILNDPTWQPILPTVAPTLSVARTSSTTAALTWNDPSDNATAYGVEYSADGINFSPCTTVAAPANSLNVGNLAARTYYFRIYAYNSVDRSAFSNIAAAAY